MNFAYWPFIAVLLTLAITSVGVIVQLIYHEYYLLATVVLLSDTFMILYHNYAHTTEHVEVVFYTV